MIITTIVSLVTVIGGIAIAYFRWRSSNSDLYKQKAKEYADKAKTNANAAISTVADAIKRLRSRADRKNRDS